ncbi:6-carboxytetrahydropterin synthase QueD [archaeon]|jgi:6-pyruvoyltetrahydropterin/6-carboxytetrahydropterin synthase|nr:6-carboxytetrahydropterin synthase QueD [archaeon]
MMLTKEFMFDSAHNLDWHDGYCKNLHGHTYKLQVSVSGKVNENGVVLDFKDLKKIVKEKIISVLDHKYLNKIITNPTAENMLLWIWDQLENELNLYELKLWETPTSFATYKGEDKC